jgi:hypothetical protein
VWDIGYWPGVCPALAVVGVDVARRPEPRHGVVLISWIDASDAFPTWAKASSVKRSDREQLVQSVGYLVAEDDDWITLATSTCDSDDPGEDHFGGGIHIPTVLVRSRTVLA